MTVHKLSHDMRQAKRQTEAAHRLLRGGDKGLRL